MPTGANSATTTNSGEINSYTDRSNRDILRHAYFACVSYTDAQVGKVLAELCGLTDPAGDADGDGSSNGLELGGGTDARRSLTLSQAQSIAGNHPGRT